MSQRIRTKNKKSRVLTYLWVLALAVLVSVLIYFEQTALLYVFSTCGFGQVVSTFTRTQVAAVFATTVLSVIPTVNFSGLLVPVSSLTGQGRVIGLMFPAAWFQPISVGTFTKGLGFFDLWFNAFVLAAFAVGYLLVAHTVLRKQET